MASDREYLHVCRFLPAMAGAVLVGAAFYLRVSRLDAPEVVPMGLLLFGCVCVALGLVSRHRPFRTTLAKASLLILSITLFPAMLEVGFRAIGFDFNRLNEPGDDVPIYYRAPSVHAGEGVLRRPGPAAWRGKVLSAYMRIIDMSEASYADEQPLLVEYDALGFRNPKDLSDWKWSWRGTRLSNWATCRTRDFLPRSRPRSLAFG